MLDVAYARIAHDRLAAFGANEISRSGQHALHFDAARREIGDVARRQHVLRLHDEVLRPCERDGGEQENECDQESAHAFVVGCWPFAVDRITSANGQR